MNNYLYNKNDNSKINDIIIKLGNCSYKYNTTKNQIDKDLIKYNEYNEYCNIINRKFQPSLIVLRHSIRLDSNKAKEFGADQNWSDKETRPFDTPLVRPQGIDLARNTAINIKNRGIIIDNIICSPLRRCIETAIEVAKVFNITEIKIDNRVIEDGKFVGEALTIKNKDNLAKAKPLLDIKMSFISDDEIKNLGGNIKFIKPSIGSKESIIPALDEDSIGFANRLYSVIDEEIIKDNRTIIVGHGGSIGMMAHKYKINNLIFDHTIDFCAWIGIFKNYKNIEFGNLDKMKSFY